MRCDFSISASREARLFYPTLCPERQVFPAGCAHMMDKRSPTPLLVMAHRAELRAILDKFCILNDVEGACKDFLIQYALFERVDGKWYMNSTIFYLTRNEGLYVIDVVESDDAHKCVKFESWKGNYESFDFYDSFDPENLSDEDVSVCAHELYDDFRPKTFQGHVWTRGGFTGWNFFPEP